VRNAPKLVRDALVYAKPPLGSKERISETEADAALRHVAAMLLRTCMDPPAAPGPTGGDNQLTAAAGSTDPPAAHVDALVGALLGYLDERLCVPRDMGAPAAAAIRALPRGQDGGSEPASPVSVSVNRF